MCLIYIYTAIFRRRKETSFKLVYFRLLQLVYYENV